MRSFFALILIALTLTACVGGDDTSGTAGVRTLRFSTVSVPRDAHTLCLYTLRNEIEKSTAKAVTVEIFHSGQLFTQESEQVAVQRGTVDMVYTDPNWLAEYVPYFSMFTMGYIFKDYQHMTRVFNGDTGKRLFDDVARRIGVRPLGAFYLGTRHLNLRDIGREVRRPEDMKGVKLRMPNSRTWLFLGQALGANPITISFSELYMALRTGTVDGQDNPLPTIYNANFYEITDNIVLTGHLVNAIFPSINEKVWEKMDVSLQERIYASVERARQVCDSINIAREEKLIDFFVSEGLKIIEPDREAFMQHVRKKYLESDEITGSWDKELLQEIEMLAEGPQ